jgi:hypothetical protein
MQSLTQLMNHLSFLNLSIYMAKKTSADAEQPASSLTFS